ncbi:hypothetical protein [Acetobacter persici]|nr:hypothetical protein [Acetobacter persici]
MQKQENAAQGSKAGHGEAARPGLTSFLRNDGPDTCIALHQADTGKTD